MTVPRVSVIIPAYDAAETIGATVASVQAQTFHDLEVVVVDDGSQDDTAAIVAGIADPRVRLVRSDHGGVAHARNVGLEASGGELVSFLDADDLWTPDKVADQVAALDADPTADVAYSWTLFVDESARFLFAKPPVTHGGNVVPELIADNFLASGSNALARREALVAAGPFDGTLSPAEDLDHWLRVAASSSFVCVPRYQVIYRLQRGSGSSDVARMAAAMRATTSRAMAAGPASLGRLAAISSATRERYAAFLLLSRGRGPRVRRAAGRRLWRSLAAHPRSVVSGRFIALAIAWFAVLLVPSRVAPAAVRWLLVLYGRAMWLRSPALRAGVAAANEVGEPSAAN